MSVLAALALLGAGACGDGSTGPVSEESNPLLKGITEAHNTARFGVSPTPSTAIPPLTWSNTVAQAAQAWANNCQFKHSSGSGYGENIFADTGSANASAVVADWVAEKANYNYANNSCAGTCGHYTQVVWRASTELGCGVKLCTSGSPFGSFNGGQWQLWVCNYNPPGNFIGQKPY